MTPLELAGLKALRSQLDALITAAEGAKPKLSPEVEAKLALEASADWIVDNWYKLTTCKVPHGLVVEWITEHGKAKVTETINAMLTKRTKTPMDARYQVNYVSKVLKANSTVPCNAGAITI